MYFRKPKSLRRGCCMSLRSWWFVKYAAEVRERMQQRLDYSAVCYVWIIVLIFQRNDRWLSSWNCIIRVNSFVGRSITISNNLVIFFIQRRNYCDDIFIAICGNDPAIICWVWKVIAIRWAISIRFCNKYPLCYVIGKEFLIS